MYVQTGLFSAVLTAFLVVSILLLQPDNSQITVQLLSLIAIQNGASTNSHPFLNDAASSLPTSARLRAPPNLVTLNILWFTSLVLSLAAALFGILAKQWCREYLRWHSVIASARENVLIRQVRFDAWQRWRVPSFIAFIPAFLETALVLFLVGLLLFVPTFSENSLTVVVSVLVASTLSGVGILTVLPVFFRLCPFQTPTGWVVVWLTGSLQPVFWLPASAIFLIIRGILSLTLRCFTSSPSEQLERLSLLARHMVVEHWTLDASAKEQKDWRAYGLYAVENASLCRVAIPSVQAACRSMAIGDVDQAAVDAVQTRVLSRALAWVRRGSRDVTVLAAITDAMATIHIVRATTGVLDRPHVLSSTHAIYAEADLAKTCEMMMKFFYGISRGSFSFTARLRSPWSVIIERSGPFIDTSYNTELNQRYRAVQDGRETNPVALEICYALLSSDLLSLVGDWLSVASHPNPHLRQKISERVVFLLCVWRIVPSHKVHFAMMSSGVDWTRHWARALEEVYRRLALHRDAYTDGLVSMCVELCRLMGPVTFDRVQGEQHIHGVLYYRAFENGADTLSYVSGYGVDERST